MDHPTPKNPPIPQTQQQPDSDMGLSNPLRTGHHRRAHSEVHFRIPDDLDLSFDGGPSSAAGFDEDDLFCTYMDVEKLGSRPDGHGSVTKPDNAGEEGEAEKSLRTRHRHSNSVDGGALDLMDSIEAKKAMAPDKLAELWTVDPKRAKRFLSLSHVLSTSFNNIGFLGHTELLFSLLKILTFFHFRIGFSLLGWDLFYFAAMIKSRPLD